MNDRRMQQIERQQIAAEEEAAFSQEGSSDSEGGEQEAVPDLVVDLANSKFDRQSWYMLKLKQGRARQGKLKMCFSGIYNSYPKVENLQIHS